MKTTKEIIKDNPSLECYIITLNEETTDDFTINFECYAEDNHHALDQVINAYPNAAIVSIKKIKTF
jgi:hypothetical protein